MDPLSTTSTDVLGANPVVLAVIEDVAYLVCADSTHIFIISANFFPLEISQETKNSDNVEAERKRIFIQYQYPLKIH